MATKDLTFNLYGRDRSASTAMNAVGGNAQRMGETFRRVGAGIAVGLAAATVAAVAFGAESVRAFKEAETSQNKLVFAYEKFGALSDLRIDALRDYNSELALTTKYDDDATAAAEATLAQFGLTGHQIMKLIPLTQDYASATGKDLTTASQDLGKALLGQGRALKAVGIEFSDTGDLTANFDQLVGKLSATVGGFAAKEGKTAAGQAEILQNRFGEFQETIGGALIPGLMDLATAFETEIMPKLEDFGAWFASDEVQANLSGFLGSVGDVIDGLVGFSDWWNEFSDVVSPAGVIALGLLTAAAIALDVALSANPIGVIIIGIIAGIAWWTSFANLVQKDVALISDNWAVFEAAGVNAVGGVIDVLQFLLGPLNGVIDAINFITGANFDNVVLPQFSATATSGRAGGKSSAPLSLAPSRNSSKRMAVGGIVPAQPGGIFANLGEGRHDEAVVPLTRQNLAAMGGGSGDTYITITLPGGFVGSEDALGKVMVRAYQNGLKRGLFPAGSLNG